MKSRFFRFLSLFLLSIVLITSCNSTTTVSSRSELPTLRVIYNLWPGNFPIAIAYEKGFFTAQGVKVEPVYIENYIESISAFSADRTDGIATSLGSIINIIGKNPDVQITQVTDQSAGADVLVVQRDIKSMKDLKGKRIGTKLGDFGELFISTLLHKNHLTTNDVTLVNVEPESVPAGLQSGDIQAGNTWQPYTGQAVKAGAKVLLSTKQTPGLLPNVIAFRTSVVRDRPLQIQAFIRAWFQAQDYWKAHPEESNALIAKKLNLKPEEVSTDGVQLYTLQDNLKAFTPGSTSESLYHTAKFYADFYTRTGGLNAALDIQKLIEPSFVQQLQKVN
ncbi:MULTISPECIES: ABC transporter substrate-binding protein [Cyanophyceae]|uniref:ABC transporter substrate-binding protein n=1 Tax=Cyanophyceae TaxID=3028117 RepID=UPI001685DB0C|nr:ABC transporter substrate-binding protein [Trichocoleus sp. FACHB-69]MBD1931091.1 ABC transporter substrate-binding protein [Trichocoleus sp. FACHB-69]